MPAESGFSNQKKFGESQFKSILGVGSDQFGAPSVSRALYSLTQGAIVDADIDSDDKRKVNVEFTAHGAREGDVLKLTSGNLVAWEFEIIEIIDTNFFVIWNIGSLNGVEEIPTAADTAEIMRWITPTVTSSGAPVAPTPVAPAGLAALDFSTLDITPVDDTTYTTLLADSGPVATKKVEIFMSSGDMMYLAFGPAAGEVDQIIIIPGGNGFIDLAIPANTRLSVKRILPPGSDTSGTLVINLLG